MRNRILVLALSLAATVLLGANAFGQACSTGATPQFIAVGSSAQFNTMAYAAADILGGVGNPADWNVWTTKSGQLEDIRPTTAAFDSGLSLWIVFDNNTTCNFYAYWSADSTIGVKDFFAYTKGITTYNPLGRTVAAVIPTPSTGVPCSSAGANLIPGLTDWNTALPAFLCTGIGTPVVPAAGQTTKVPEPYCGQSASAAASFFCYFNAGATDIRPEDALYATQRALSVYTTTNGLAGLGYGQAACGGDGLATSEEGCTLYDSFHQKKAFNVLRFALTGTDPFTHASVPAYSTLTTGADPVVVFVNNGDTSNLGFGNGAPTGPYKFTDINHKVLGFVFDGTTHCTGDILPIVPSVTGGTSNSTGEPIQVVEREPLSGTYNTFEFTGVRTASGSAATAVNQSKISSSSWLTDNDSGQELNNNPANGWTGGSLSSGCGGPIVAATGGGFVTNGAPLLASAPCGDPVLIKTGSTSNNGNGPANCGQGLRARAIGTGEEVKATIATYNSVTNPSWGITDGIGYSFWGYQNFAPLVSSSSCTTEANGNATCSSFSGHYLTVDAIDPLYITEGGQYDPTPNPQPFNPPQCSLVLALGTSKCEQIPFTNLFNGKYPLWSLLRLVTFEKKTTVQFVPPGVLNIVAYAEQEAAPGSTYQLSDFAPFLTNLVNSGTITSPAWTGDLNLGVFRSHFKQTGGTVTASDGHAACAGNFTGVALIGGTSGSSTCLIDTGSDVGGSVFTVQTDVDFNSDFGNDFLTSGNSLYEIYGLHQ